MENDTRSNWDKLMDTLPLEYQVWMDVNGDSELLATFDCPRLALKCRDASQKALSENSKARIYVEVLRTVTN